MNDNKSNLETAIEQQKEVQQPNEIKVEEKDNKDQTNDGKVEQIQEEAQDVKDEVCEDAENKKGETKEEDNGISSDTEETNETEDKVSDDKNEELSKIDNKDEASKVLEDKGFDYTALQKEFLETGEISQESRQKLEKAGITSDIVDNYIEGQKAKVEAEKNEYAQYIGGRKNYNEVVSWAEKNLSREEIISINSVRDKNIIKIILKDLKNRMDEKEGKIPEYIEGDGTKSVQNIFRSQAEMFEAISNPKYKKDEAYRKDVQKKIAASRAAGVNLGI